MIYRRCGEPTWTSIEITNVINCLLNICWEFRFVDWKLCCKERIFSWPIEYVFYTITICSILTPVRPDNWSRSKIPFCIFCGICRLTPHPHPFSPLTILILNTLWIVKPYCITIWESIWIFSPLFWICCFNIMEEFTFLFICSILWTCWFAFTQTVYIFNIGTISTLLTLWTSDSIRVGPRHILTIICEHTRAQPGYGVFNIDILISPIVCITIIIWFTNM